MGTEDDYEPGEIQALVASSTLLEFARSTELPADVLRTLLGTISEPVVHEHLTEKVEADPLGQATVEALLAAAASETERGHALLLAAGPAEGRRDYATAEHYLNEASRLVPTCWPVISEAVGYAAARGDAARTDALLSSAGTPADDPVRQALRPLLRPAEGVVSRNRQCPCGSGRKYKACCLHSVRHPLPVRARFVYARLALHAQRPRVADMWSRFVTRIEQPALPLALDLGLFDAGVADDYLACRGHLLPDDERQLIESWIASPLAPYEVDDAQPGRLVKLRPLTGVDRVVVHDRAFSTSVSRLDVLLVRPLFNGREPTLLSLPTYVHRMRRAALQRLFDAGGYDVDAVAAFFGPQPPPKLRNRDGEDLVLCEAVYRVDSEEEPGAWERLHEHLGVDEDADNRLVLAGRRVPGDEYVLRGSISREGAGWTVETNSVERFEELRRLVRDAAPDAILISASTQPADEVLDEYDDDFPDEDDDTAFSDRDDPEFTPQQEAALLDEYVQTYEKGWVEEPVPALGGRSPREAVAAGGAELAELQALLNDIEWMYRQNGGGMDATRLRALLDLPARARR